MNNLYVAVTAVSPFLIYMALGFLVRRLGWADDFFLHKLNTVSFKLFFPPMMFNCVYKLEGQDLEVNGVFILCALSALALVVIGALLLVPRLVSENSRRGVIIQGIYRTNIVFFALPIAQSVFGDSALMPSALMVAMVVPTYNVLAVVILEYYHGTTPSPARLALDVLKNPIILGFLTGLAFYFLQIRLPSFIEAPVITLSNLAIPLALIALGGTIRINDIVSNLRCIAATLSVKMVLLPLAVFLLLLFVPLPLSKPEMFLLIIMFAAPIASASYPMAENMGGDGKLAGQLVAISSAASVITLFLWVLAFTSIMMA